MLVPGEISGARADRSARPFGPGARSPLLYTANTYIRVGDDVSSPKTGRGGLDPGEVRDRAGVEGAARRATDRT
jgi:hypothetical protein